MATNEELKPTVEKIEKILEDYNLADCLTILKLVTDDLQVPLLSSGSI